MSFSQDVSLSNKMAEKMLEEISKQGLLTNDTLSMFEDQNLYNLKVLKLPEINMNASGQQLMNYSAFNLRCLELGCTTALNRWSMKKLAQSFNGSCYSLTSLKLNLYPAVNITSGTIFDFFIRFPNLKNLFYDSPISGNAQTFTNANWTKLLTSCSLLQVLNININGSSKDIELDSKIFEKSTALRSLSLYSALKSEVALQSLDCIQHFANLDDLRVLDLSVDVDPQVILPVQLHGEENENDMQNDVDTLAGYVNTFLICSLNKLPLLESLDVSGIYRIKNDNLHNFIESHENLQFIGLCMLYLKICMNGDVAENYSHIKVSLITSSSNYQG